jgi:hypothetical protein
MSVIAQGKFTATGSAVTLKLRSDFDWFKCLNFTVADDDTQTTAVGVEYYWQRGFASGRGIEYKKSNAANAAQLTTVLDSPNGFTLIDSSVQTPGGQVAVTGLTAASPPVATAATALAVGDIVRFESLDNQSQISGIDFSVTAANTIGNINLANSTASTAGFYRVLPFDPIFYPRRRYVTWVENAVQPKVYFSVTHDYVLGEKVTLSFPGGSAVWGDYAQLDGVVATVVALNSARAGNEPNNGGTANNIELDIDTSSYAAWNTFGAGGNEGYPASTLVPFTPAQVIPVGQNTAQSLALNADILAAATRNDAYLGLKLAAGADAPAGQVGEVVYWWAGKADYVDNDGDFVV